MVETKEIIEKIEVLKNGSSYFYTGTFLDLENGWVEINTTRGEKYQFRREQIEQRLLNPANIQKKLGE